MDLSVGRSVFASTEPYHFPVLEDKLAQILSCSRRPDVRSGLRVIPVGAKGLLRLFRDGA